MITANGSSSESNQAEARRTMVRTQLQRRDITDTRVLQAMAEVPRHLFVPQEWRHKAYSDRPLPIGQEQTISQPYMVAIMVQSLGLQGHERVLDVGTGSGYQAAVLSRLAAHVYTIEYFPALAEHARTVLQGLGYTNVEVIVGDGSLGFPSQAPFDGIIAAAAASRIPPPLLAQLADGGRLVMPVGEHEGQNLVVVRRDGEAYTEEYSVPCRFVPLLGREGRA